MNTNDLIKLADLLDSKGEHDSASEIDKLIKSAAEPTDPNIEQPEWMGEEDTEVDEGPREEDESPDDFREHEREKRPSAYKDWDLKSLSQNIMEEITYYLEAPNSEEHYKELLNLLSRYKDQWMNESYPVSYDPESTAVANINNVFQKLSKVADDLDGVGARKEADMIDSFLQKYAGEIPIEMGEILEFGEEDLMEGLEDEEEEGFGPETEGEVEEIMRELEKLEGRREVLISKLSNEPVKHKLSKRAEGYDEDRKPEGDTEQSKRYDSKYHHSLQIREPKTDKERVDREGRQEQHVETYKPSEGSLSTRYCPSHIGTMMARVGPSSYQCPLDGEVFNWETGYTTFDGVSVPGGSVAAQTPDSTGYQIPNRVFDSREKVLNVIN